MIDDDYEGTDYTCITFTPDWKRFHMTGLEADTIALLKKVRCVRLCRALLSLVELFPLLFNRCWRFRGRTLVYLESLCCCCCCCRRCFFFSCRVVFFSRRVRRHSWSVHLKVVHRLAANSVLLRDHGLTEGMVPNDFVTLRPEG